MKLLAPWFGMGTLTILGISGLTGIGLIGELVPGLSFSSLIAVRPAKPAEVKVDNRLDGSFTAAMLHRVGLTPEAMAAAGLSAAETEEVVLRMAVHLESMDNQAQIQLATRQLARVQDRAARPGYSHAAVPINRADAGVSIAEAHEAISEMLNDAFHNAVAGLSPEQRQTLATIRAHARLKLPAEYLVVERTHADWVRLRGALGARRAAGIGGRPIKPETAQFLQLIESDAAVARARVSLQQNTEEITIAWHSRVAALP